MPSPWLLPNCSRSRLCGYAVTRCGNAGNATNKDYPAQPRPRQPPLAALPALPRLFCIHRSSQACDHCAHRPPCLLQRASPSPFLFALTLRFCGYAWGSPSLCSRGYAAVMRRAVMLHCMRSCAHSRRCLDGLEFALHDCVLLLRAALTIAAAALGLPCTAAALIFTRGSAVMRASLSLFLFALMRAGFTLARSCCRLCCGIGLALFAILYMHECQYQLCCSYR